ncbi:MAG: transcriptional regulator, partial [Bacteroidota bacterium]
MSDLKNDISWQQIFAKHNIIERVLRDGHVLINATDINVFREARLMTKFDHKSQLPKLFSENNLSILPISRGSYIIADLETFHNFEENEEVDIKKADFPNYLESLDYKNITSESTAINCAFVAGILHDFTGETLLIPTISGRMSSLCFAFNINSSSKVPRRIDVENSQIEIDGGYEGNEALNLIEAKNYISNDFLVRQIYYPYRLWAGKIRKPINSIFLTYTNGIFHLRQYEFTELGNYNSLVLHKQNKYTVREGALNIETIQKILNQIVIVPEPEIAF